MCKFAQLYACHELFLKYIIRVIRSRKSKKDRQCNDQKKKYKRTNNHFQKDYKKKKIEKQEHRKKPGMNSGVPEGLAVT